jgi:hypothetical protein
MHLQHLRNLFHQPSFSGSSEIKAAVTYGKVLQQIHLLMLKIQISDSKTVH